MSKLEKLEKLDTIDVIVFDLDYTLWPFWVDTHVDPPFHQTKDGEVFDSRHVKIKFYPDVTNVLRDLKEAGYKLAVASRTSELEGANQLLKLFGWDSYFDNKQIYPGCKIKHFRQIEQQFKCPKSRMMFFDDERRNIDDLGPLGVHCVYVEQGVNRKMVIEAINRVKHETTKGL